MEHKRRPVPPVGSPEWVLRVEAKLNLGDSYQELQKPQTAENQCGYA